MNNLDKSKFHSGFCPYILVWFYTKNQIGFWTDGMESGKNRIPDFRNKKKRKNTIPP